MVSTQNPIRRIKLELTITTLLTLVLIPATALPSVFYVDPQNGSRDGDGSRARPWHTLQQVIEDKLVQGRQCENLPYAPDCNMVVKNPSAPVKPGDTISLLSGYHGQITIQDAYLDEPITVQAEPGATSKIKSLRCLGASNWIFRGLSISPSHADLYEKVSDLIMLENSSFHGPCKEVTVENCKLFSVEDSFSWSAEDWNSLSCSGISVQGTDCIIRNNHLKNVNFGISVSGPNAVIDSNTIENFAGDGLRGIGDYGLFEHNLVMNCYDVNENHDDGFQSWSFGSQGVGTGEVKGVVLRANTIINYTDPDQPLRGPLQGIGCFDGFYTDWIVENNVIITDHWHGISFLGARNVRIVNNTVLDINQAEPGPAWIKIGPHKNGTPSSAWVVRNNLVMSLQTADTGTTDHNLVVDFDWLGQHLIDYSAHDVHLTKDSPAIDSGSANLAPYEDHDGVTRPKGAGFDIGAYEWFEQVQPDAGPDADDAGDLDDTDDLSDGSQDDGLTDTSDSLEGTDAGSDKDQSNLPDAGDTSGGKVNGNGCSCSSDTSYGSFFLFLLAACLIATKNRLTRK